MHTCIYTHGFRLAKAGEEKAPQALAMTAYCNTCALNATYYKLSGNVALLWKHRWFSESIDLLVSIAINCQNSQRFTLWLRLCRSIAIYYFDCKHQQRLVLNIDNGWFSNNQHCHDNIIEISKHSGTQQGGSEQGENIATTKTQNGQLEAWNVVPPLSFPPAHSPKVSRFINGGCSGSRV